MIRKLTPLSKTVGIALLVGAASTQVQAETLGDTTFKYSGYIKADAIFSDYSNGTLASGNLGRDFYVP